MPDIDKTTIKVRAYPDNAKKPSPQSNLTEEQDYALELHKKTAQLEEAKSKLLGHEHSIETLRTTLAKEQEKSAELSKKLVALEAEHKKLQDSSGKNNAQEARIKELTNALNEISGIAAATTQK